MSNVSIFVQLGIITQQINRYVSTFLFLFGAFGNLLNCLIFTQRKLRLNPCSVYFLVASLLNLIVVLASLIPRIMDGWKPEFNLTETVCALCKIDLYVIYSACSIVTWMIALASIDRHLVSSPNIHRRQMSNLKNTYRRILFTCIILFFVWLPVIFCFDVNMVVGIPRKCFPKSDVCGLYTNLAQAFMMVIFPMIVMLSFGFCTIRNIHQRRRVASNNITGHIISRNRRSERSLTKMLLSQVLTLVLLNSPFAIITFYLSCTFYQEKSPVQRAIENFLFNIFLLVLFIPNCISFFLYTLSGSLFRETFINLVKKILRHLRC